jgi:phosphatidylglycerophosphate synthase
LGILRRPFAPLAAPLAGAGLSADALTIAAFVAGLGAIAAIATGHALWGAGLIVLSRILDGLDGDVARATRPTHRGALLDLLLGFILAAALPFGFVLAQPDRALAALVLVFGLASYAVTALALALAAARAGRAVSSVGATDKSAVSIAMLIACFLPAWFNIIAYSIGTICFIALIVRLAAIRFRTA